MRKVLVAAFSAVAALIVAPVAVASHGYSLEGGATAGDGYVQLVSDLADAASANDASWIDFDVPSGLTFASLTSLSAQFDVTDDGCGGGSPRFQVNVGGKNVFVYLGSSPSFTGCPTHTWLSSGNLVGTADQCRVDTSQLSPGTQCTTWAAAVALLGHQAVTGVQLVTDGGWFFADREQTVLVRSVVINGRTYVTHRRPSSRHPEHPGHAGNPAKLCKEQRSSLGLVAFQRLWGTNPNARNAFGRCVSYMATAWKKRTAEDVHRGIMDAIAVCKARALHGQRLGACTAKRDRCEATKPDRAGASKGKGGAGRSGGKGRLLREEPERLLSRPQFVALSHKVVPLRWRSAARGRHFTLWL